MFSEKFQAALQAIYSSYHDESVNQLPGVDNGYVERQFLIDIMDKMAEVELSIPPDKKKDIEAIIESIE
jgi:hypothetical protein